MRPTLSAAHNPRLLSDHPETTGHFAPAPTNASASCAGCRRPIAAGLLVRWRDMDRCPACTLRALQALPLPTRPPSLMSRSLRTIATQNQGRFRV